MRRLPARDINQRRRFLRTQVSGWSQQAVSSWLNPTPALLSPYAWYDAADTSTITESGGFVSQWNDISGNGRNVSQASGTSQPVTGSSTLNGLNTILFDGSNDVLNYTTPNVADFTSLSFFCVARINSYANLIPRIVEISSASGVGRIWDSRDDSPNDNRIQLIISRSADTSFISPNGIVTLGSWFQSNITWRGGLTVENYVGRFINNEYFGSFGTTGSGAATSTASNILRVGNSSAGTRSWPGEIAELIIFNRSLELSEILLVERYFNQKWGV